MRIYFKTRSVLAFAAVAILSVHAHAQIQEQTPLHDVPGFFLFKLKEANNRDTYLDAVMRVLRDYSKDGQTLTRDDLQRYKNKLEQELVAAQVAEFTKQDVDGDRQVTFAEAEASIVKRYGAKPEGGKQKIVFDLRVARIMERDLNGDGSISADEVKAPARPRGLLSNYVQKALTMNMPYTLLSRQDVTADQLRQYAVSVFAAADRDKDGVISQGEKQAIDAASEAAAEKSLIAQAVSGGCVLPAPAADSQVVLLPAMQGVMSSAALFDETMAAYASEVNISRDVPKTYLVLTSHAHPFIWRLTGATDRLEHVVVLAGEVENARKRLAAVTGVPRERVTFASTEDCSFDLLQQQIKSKGIPLTEEILSGVLKRHITAHGIGNKLLRARLSAQGVVMEGHAKAEIGPAPAGYDAKTWQDIVQGLGQAMIAFTPEEIASGVAELPLSSYRTPPAGYGLAKLVHDGVLRAEPNGKKFRIYHYESGNVEIRPESRPQPSFPDAVTREGEVEGRDFRLMKPLPFFPAHNFDRLGVYILDEGIQRPEGDESACVMSSETGKALAVWNCPP